MLRLPRAATIATLGRAQVMSAHLLNHDREHHGRQWKLRRISSRLSRWHRRGRVSWNGPSIPLSETNISTLCAGRRRALSHPGGGPVRYQSGISAQGRLLFHAGAAWYDHYRSAKSFPLSCPRRRAGAPLWRRCGAPRVRLVGRGDNPRQAGVAGLVSAQGSAFSANPN